MNMHITHRPKSEVINITGPAGPQGEPGPQGPAGPPGPQGTCGVAGIAGQPGMPGPIGSAGPAGVHGYPGSMGPIGPIGSQGLTGPQGATGSVGEMGPTGQVGEIGPTGVQGATGHVGEIGPTGVQGATGQVGEIGPTGGFPLFDPSTNLLIGDLIPYVDDVLNVGTENNKLKNIYVSNITLKNTIQEQQTITTATTPITLDYSLGSSFYLSGIDNYNGNFECDVINLPSITDLSHRYLIDITYPTATYHNYCNNITVSETSTVGNLVTLYYEGGNSNISTSISGSNFVIQKFVITYNGNVNVFSGVKSYEF
jgi:hypothetical protein